MKNLFEIKYNNIVEASKLMDNLKCYLNILEFENEKLEGKEKIKKCMIKINKLLEKSNIDILHYLGKMNQEISEVLES